MKGIWEGESCYFCGRTDWIEYHHVFGGANRKKPPSTALSFPYAIGAITSRAAYTITEKSH